MTSRSSDPRVVAVLAASCLLLAGGRARAQDDAAIANRRAMIADAQEAHREGNHEHAAELLRRAASIESNPSLQRALALELEETRDFVGALAAAERCRREAHGASDAAHLRACAGIEADLEPQLGHLRVHTPTPFPEGMQVYVNGTALSEAVWGEPAVVNPGTTHISATAPGRRTFEADVDVASGATGDVTIDLPSRAAVVDTPPPPPPPIEDPARPQPRRDTSWMPHLLGTSIAAGVFLVAGVTTSVLAEGRAQVYNADCVPTLVPGCTAVLSEYSTLDALRLVSWIATGALAVTAIVFLVLELSRPPRHAADVSFSCGAGSCSFAL